jgi:hypothetical protein
MKMRPICFHHWCTSPWLLVRCFLVSGWIGVVRATLTVWVNSSHSRSSQGKSKENALPLARSDYKVYTGDYSTKPPSTKPPITSPPRDSRGCRSVTQTYPNASEARPMSLRYEWRKAQGVDDLWWVDIQKVVRLWIPRSSASGCSPWKWYRGVGVGISSMA